MTNFLHIMFTVVGLWMSLYAVFCISNLLLFEEPGIATSPNNTFPQIAPKHKLSHNLTRLKTNFLDKCCYSLNPSSSSYNYYPGSCRLTGGCAKRIRMILDKLFDDEKENIRKNRSLVSIYYQSYPFINDKGFLEFVCPKRTVLKFFEKWVL